ncbi:hypothetical protein H5183_12845 [Pseudoalteromonas sp. SR44-8]|uniref:hypothetical protein n=1 Tax=Pseudoalteromonas sp. SR44-8 TaxID=2760933 RepID=UPI0015FF96DB|nr:hypothetical protein [Pseudoalteromonas sp. SR44-8]MBB1302230.1 hypothetical protein [Pseudoalteromonas sp. SR44-8]
MEPISAFSTIIGLICNFKAEQRSTSDDNYKEFIEWLDTKRHKNVVNELHSNHLLGISIKNLLSRNHDSILQKLTQLDCSLIDLASQIDGLKDIASAVSPHAGLSDQALSILKQFDESGGSVFLETKVKEGTYYQVMDAQGDIKITDGRFVNDDLDKLCDLGLLTPDYNKSGGKLFRFTRAAAKLVEQVKGEL